MNERGNTEPSKVNFFLTLGWVVAEREVLER